MGLALTPPLRAAQIAGNKPTYDFYASFEVADAAKDEVTVAIMTPGPFGASGEWSKWGGLSRRARPPAIPRATHARPPRRAALGHVTVAVKDCAWQAGQAVPAARAYPLLDSHNKALAGGAAVTLQLLLVAAPDAAAPLRVLVGTWNVGNEPPCADLSPWLRAAQAGPDPDLVALGAQECTYGARSPHASCDDDWVASLAAALGPAYVRVRNDSLGQMRLALFARADVRPAVTEHEASAEATGLGHVHSNKGGVASMLSVWDTSVCFINAHLAAHQNKVKRRNEDYSEIVAGCEMGERGMDVMNQFHHVVWMGDLNYRLDLSDLFGEEAANAKTPPPELFDNIKASVAGGAFGPLAACDQLTRARLKGDAFVGFQEGALCHPPTFKVKRAPGLEYNTQRSPAYCDRVLWRSLPGMGAKQEALWCAPEVDSSDHKPVACVLALQRRPPRAAWVPRRPALPDVAAGTPRKSHASALKEAGNARSLPTWRLQITALFGHGLMAADYNGKSDPYVAFLGVPLVKMAVTQVVYATLDPTWSIDKLPTLRLAAPSADALSNDYILVNVVDYDATSPDDPIGCGVLRCGDLLDAAAAAPGGEIDFEVPLTYAGLEQGKLSGRLRVTPGPPMPLHELQAAKRVVKRIAPKKRFSLSRALGLKKDPVIAVHVPYREGAREPRSSEAGSQARTSVASARTSVASQRLSVTNKPAEAPSKAPAAANEDDDDDDDEDD